MADEKDVVKNVVEILHDGHKGFFDLAEKLHDSQAKAFFLKESQTRAQYALELEAAVGLNKDQKDTSGTVVGAVHRFWGDLKGKLGGGDHTLLETAEQGEDAAKKAYKEALEEDSLSTYVRHMLQQQQIHVEESHDRVKALRDQKAA